MLVFFRERPRPVAWRQALLRWQQPDLIEVDGLGRRRIEFAVLNSGSRRHPLKLTDVDDRAVAHAVPVFQLPFQDIGDDLHVPVAVHAKALAGLHPILVHDPQRPEAHVDRIVVGVEREGVPSIEPIVLGMATVTRLTDSIMNDVLVVPCLAP